LMICVAHIHLYSHNIYGKVDLYPYTWIHVYTHTHTHTHTHICIIWKSWIKINSDFANCHHSEKSHNCKITILFLSKCIMENQFIFYQRV
jgi:hypothetical protein